MRRLLRLKGAVVALLLADPLGSENLKIIGAIGLLRHEQDVVQESLPVRPHILNPTFLVNELDRGGRLNLL